MGIKMNTSHPELNTWRVLVHFEGIGGDSVIYFLVIVVFRETWRFSLFSTIYLNYHLNPLIIY